MLQTIMQLTLFNIMIAIITNRNNKMLIKFSFQPGYVYRFGGERVSERKTEQWRNHLLRAASLHLPVPFLEEITRSTKLYNAHSYIAAQKYYLKMILYSKEQVDCESKSKGEREAFAAHNEGESGCVDVCMCLCFWMSFCRYCCCCQIIQLTKYIIAYHPAINVKRVRRLA